jgi:hypothetical protein
MQEEWLERIEQGFFQKHNRHLNDLQSQVLRRCFDSNQTYEQIATELGYTHGTINGVAADLWQLLSEVFGEKITKANLRGAVKRFIDSVHPVNPESLPLSPSVNRVFISDRSQNLEPNALEQLQIALQEAEQEAIISEDWLQRSNEELSEYDCFVLLVSSHSTAQSDIIIREIQRARELRETRQDQTLAILLIHANSCMSLPLNHHLHKELQGILQLEWRSSTELPTLVKEIMRRLDAENDPPPVKDPLDILIKNLRKLKISDNWMLTYVGENQLHHLGDLVRDLKNRQIPSGYAYWGVGPTRMWVNACNDPAYHMRENIERFPEHARQLANCVNKEQYNFVSLGVGEGSKDSNIITDFFYEGDPAKPRDDFLYLPVDMSLDMLRVAIGNIRNLPSHRRIAIQRDIETKDGMRQISYIADVLGEKKPILYGFIGNTIANVKDPKGVLNNIVQVMKTEDLLLFEAQIIDDSALENNQLQETIRSVREEYKGISFRQFALSALLQNSDLSVEPREKNSCYLVETSLQPWEYGQFLQIDCWFKNNTGRRLFLTFSNEDTTTLNQEEKISLYCSRKFTQITLKNFVGAMNLKILDKSTYLSDKSTGFMVIILQRQN